MKRLIDALSELLEAKAELLMEEAAMLHLGKFAEGYKAGQQDIFANSEVVYVTGDDEDEDSPDCG
jgi:hypothetical protein